MVSINSTLVETVSINYEDFNESFLTCGTCLCEYHEILLINRLQLNKRSVYIIKISVGISCKWRRIIFELFLWL